MASTPTGCCVQKLQQLLPMDAALGPDSLLTAKAARDLENVTSDVFVFCGHNKSDMTAVYNDRCVVCQI